MSRATRLRSLPQHLLLLVAALSGCHSSEIPERLDERRAVEQGGRPTPFLYQVSRDDGPVSHLFGTMHMGVRLDEYADAVAALISEADEVHVENADLSSALNYLRLHLAILKDIAAGNLTRLEPHHRSELERQLGSAAASAEGLPPYVVCAMLVQAELGDSPGQLDDEVVSAARAAERPVRNLDSVATQIEAMKHLCTLDELRRQLETSAGADADTSDAVDDAFRRGDAEGLVRANDEWLRGLSPERRQVVLDVFFTQRNEDWVEHLDGVLGEKRIFVAVGALHLVGPDNIVERLRERGFAVTRL